MNIYEWNVLLQALVLNFFSEYIITEKLNIIHYSTSTETLSVYTVVGYTLIV